MGGSQNNCAWQGGNDEFQEVVYKNKIKRNSTSIVSLLSSQPTPTSNQYNALVDTAENHNYFSEDTTDYYENTKPVSSPHVKVANGNIITPTGQAKIKLSSELSDEAQHVFMFDDLATELLLSIG